MTQAEIKFATTAIELVARYGLPAAIATIQSLSAEAVTEADIDELRAQVRPPEAYFEEVQRG